MGGVVQCRQAVSHAVHDAQTHIGEAHASNVLAQGHALPAFRGILHSAPQVLADQADGLQVEHIGNGAMALGDVALNGVGQCGIEAIISGSTTAISGISLVSTQTNLRFFSTSVMT